NLASVMDKKLTETQSWLSPYQDLVATLSHEPNAHKRIEYLDSALKKWEHPIVVSALYDRIWAEQLALGHRPTHSLGFSANKQWQQEQYCWANALGLQTEGFCPSSNLKDALVALTNYQHGTDLFEVKDTL